MKLLLRWSDEKSIDVQFHATEDDPEPAIKAAAEIRKNILNRQDIKKQPWWLPQCILHVGTTEGCFEAPVKFRSKKRVIETENFGRVPAIPDSVRIALDSHGFSAGGSELEDRVISEVGQDKLKQQERWLEIIGLIDSEKIRLDWQSVWDMCLTRYRRSMMLSGQIDQIVSTVKDAMPTDNSQSN